MVVFNNLVKRRIELTLLMLLGLWAFPLTRPFLQRILEFSIGGLFDLGAVVGLVTFIIWYLRGPGRNF